MAIDRPQGVIREAFLGEKAGNVAEVDRMVGWARRINSALRPVDDVAKRAAVPTCQAVIGEITGGRFGTVGDMAAAQTRVGVAEQREIEGKMIQVGQVVFLAARDGSGGMAGTPDYSTAMATGVATSVDNLLPTPLKGSGREVVNCVFANPDVHAVLDQVNQAAEDQYWEATGVDVRVLDDAVDALRGLGIGKGHADRGQWELAMRYLGGLKALSKTVVSSGNDPAILAELQQLRRLQEDQLAREEAMRQAEQLPATEVDQLVFVRRLLERIESTQRTTRDYTLGPVAARIEEYASGGMLHERVRVEALSRLKLHDCAVLMSKANGYIETPKNGGDPECPTVGMAATLADGLHHALDAEAINFFLKTDANGIPVAMAWDLYQEANTGYKVLLGEIETARNLTTGSLTNNLRTAVDNDPDLGTIEATYYTDGDPVRGSYVDTYIIDKIVWTAKIDRGRAEKAWELAKKLSKATGEDSIFNAAMAGNDEMAEDLYLKLYRSGRDQKGRPRGPQIHVNKIVGVGNSFLREMSGVSAYANGGGIQPFMAKDVIAVPTIVKDRATGKDVGRGIEGGKYVYHFAVWWSGKIHPLRNLLLDRQPDPKKLISLDMMQAAVDYFNKADVDGRKHLRNWWIAGVLDMASSYSDLGWTMRDYDRFRMWATDTRLSDNTPAFLSKSEWEALEREYKLKSKMRNLERQRRSERFASTVFGQR